MYENRLIYSNSNQTYIFTVKGDEITVYLQKFILGQLVVAANSPENIDNYFCARNEAKLIIPIYKAETVTFLLLKTKLAYFILRNKLFIVLIL